ncbi:hypothetical protein OS493_033562 [Desmophyllum pertusum]|uniref:Uncharacterized protein n=1 Tax=Desmophyllum pertusum TaxID=174260 RepID=A0A9W9YVG9_9CNID|nr:hypothetical protein OS493_033562 [Desmophyllum pertusum]
MFSFLRTQAVTLIVSFFASQLVYQAESEVYIDGRKGLKRDTKNGVAYANFAAHKFRHLKLTPLVSTSVKELGECDSLFSEPCMNGATCVAKYEVDDYQCACAPGYIGKHCDEIGIDCQDIKKRGYSQGDGVYYLLDPDGGNHSNAFLAYCDMTSYNGGWTMCYTTDEYVKPKTEVTYNAQFPYGSDGYRTNCNNISFTEIIFVDHQTGAKAYFKRQTNQSITAANNYGIGAGTYGLWDGMGAADTAYSYQVMICDTSFYSGFFVSGYTNCYKVCNGWCGDGGSPYFRTASTSASYKGVAFNTNGHRSVGSRLISVGLR